MTLRKEYQAIAGKWQSAWGNGDDLAVNAISKAVADCQALADQPPKMLTLGEIVDIAAKQFDYGYSVFARAIEAAHIAKQRTPETRKVKVYIYTDESGDIHAASPGVQVNQVGAKIIDTFEREVTLP